MSRSKPALIGAIRTKPKTSVPVPSSGGTNDNDIKLLDMNVLTVRVCCFDPPNEMVIDDDIKTFTPSAVTGP